MINDYETTLKRASILSHFQVINLINHKVTVELVP
jgi:hypothetical protein